MSWFGWKPNKHLAEEARQVRGKLAQEIVRNDRVRSRIETNIKEKPIGDMLSLLLQQIDEGRRD